MFAVKHPLATLLGLIRNPTPRPVYLSHPISAIRRTEAWTDNQLLDEIQQVAARLRRKYLLFEPTTIDELRINDRSTASAYRLAKRWPPLRSGKSKDSVLLPTTEAPDEKERRDLVLFNAEIDASDLGRLKAVYGRIDHQIDWRDRQLVSQSPSLIVLRPFGKGDGKLSAGVYQEIKLHAVLFRLGGRSKGIVFHPRSDERERRRRAVEQIIYGENELLINEDQLMQLRALVEKSLLAEIEQAIAKNEGPTLVAKLAAQAVRERGLEFRLKNPHAGKSTLTTADRENTQHQSSVRFGKFLIGAVLSSGSEFNKDYLYHSLQEMKDERHFYLIEDDLYPSDLIDVLLDAAKELGL